MTDIASFSLARLRRSIAESRIDPTDVVVEQRALASSVGAALNAFTELIDDPVRRDGPLAGVPIAVKDVFVDAGRPPTMGSLVHARAMTGTAEVLERLRAAGATIVGYTNLHEWAIGTTSVVTATGPIRNPWDRERIAGGSSGGSAAAVAAGIVPAAIGTDAGGSTRIPAACCGIVGLKPSFGAISLRGEAGASSPVNAAGILTRSVDDARFLFELLAERTTAEIEARLRLGVPRDPLFENVRVEVRTVMEGIVTTLGKVMQIVPVTMPGVERAGALVSRSYLADMAEVVGTDLEQRPRDFHPSTLKALRRGLSSRHDPEFDPGPVRAAWAAAFERCDVVLTPTLPAVAPRIKERKLELPSGAQSTDRSQIALNAPMNVAGLPSMSVPCAEVNGLPVSVTLTAPAGAEDVVLGAGQALEARLDRAFADRVTANG